MKLGSVVFIEP